MAPSCYCHSYCHSLLYVMDNHMILLLPQLLYAPDDLMHAKWETENMACYCPCYCHYSCPGRLHAKKRDRGRALA